jgi:hypothetical protein
MVQGHIRLGGPILKAHIFENKAAFFFQMTTAAFLIWGDTFSVGIVQELHRGHCVAP